MIKRPFDLLNSLVGKEVVIGMKGNKRISGKMLAFDIHMNVVLENAVLEETEGEETKTRELGSVFLRGDSLIYVSPK